MPEDVLLALEPEELAAELLFLMRKRFGRAVPPGVERYEPVHPGHCIGEVLNDRCIKPSEKREEIAAALAEAFGWLEAQALLVPQPGRPEHGWKILSRRACRFESKAGFLAYAGARRLPRELLHPELRQTVWLSFVRNEFAEAVFKAMRAVEIAVREAAGFPQGDHGVPMMRRAFHKDNGPLRDPGQEDVEREALMHLFAGAIGSYKNPHSHRNVPMDDPEEAIEIVMLASHLLRIVDARRAPSAGKAG